MQNACWVTSKENRTGFEETSVENTASGSHSHRVREWQIPGLGFCQTLTLTDCRDGRGVVCEWARGGRIYNRESRISRSVKDAEHEM